MSNTFLAAQDTLRHSLYTHYGSKLLIVTTIVYLLGALNLVVIPAILVVRWHSGQFWLFRIHTIRAWKLVSPNPLIGWLISSLGFFACEEHPFESKVGCAKNADMLFIQSPSTTTTGHIRLIQSAQTSTTTLSALLHPGSSVFSLLAIFLTHYSAIKVFYLDWRLDLGVVSSCCSFPIISKRCRNIDRISSTRHTTKPHFNCGILSYCTSVLHLRDAYTKHPRQHQVQ